MKEVLTALYALQQIDSAIAALQKRYAALDSGQVECAAFEAARSAHAAAQHALHDMSTSQRDFELELQAIETKSSEVEKRLYSGEVQAAKELQAMQDELAMLGRQRARLDEKVLTLLDEIEASRSRVAETQNALEIAEVSWTTTKEEYDREVTRISATARTLAAERKDALEHIAADMLKRYDTLRAGRGGVAIVALVDGNACGGCKMGLPTTQVIRVREGRTLEYCDNCRRILCVASCGERTFQPTHCAPRTGGRAFWSPRTLCAP